MILKGPIYLGLSFSHKRWSQRLQVDSEILCPGWSVGEGCCRRVPDRVVLAHPVVHRREVRGVSRPQEERRLKSQNAPEGGHTNRCFVERILSVDNNLISAAVGEQELANLLVEALYLSIGMK